MELRHQYDLNLLLDQTKMARSSFYYYQKQSKTPDKYKVIKEWITSIYHKHKGRYDYRRITDELNNKGIIINHKTVLRLMKSLGLKSVIRIRKYKSYKGEQGKIAPNVLERNFKASAPNQKWATDITLHSDQGWQYQMKQYQHLLHQKGIVQSMSRKGNCFTLKNINQ